MMTEVNGEREVKEAKSVSHTVAMAKLLERLREKAKWNTRELVNTIINDVQWQSSMASGKLREALNTLVVAGKLETFNNGKMIGFSGAEKPKEDVNREEVEQAQAKLIIAIAARETAIKQGIEKDSLVKSLNETIARLQHQVETGGPKEIVLKVGDAAPKLLKGARHPAYEKIMKLANARRNIMLIGPAGTGKTYLARQVIEDLGLHFSHISCTAGMSEGQLVGRLLPGEGGKFAYVPSELVMRYEQGGGFLWDEMDAADSNTMMVVNAALANGEMALTNRPGKPIAKKHSTFIGLAAVNTYGTGQDRQYVGRNQLDESTLDRFRIGQVEIDYDSGFDLAGTQLKSIWRPPVIDSSFRGRALSANTNSTERALCPDDDLRVRLQWYRHRVRESKIRRIVSMRFLQDAYIMKQHGFDDKDIDDALFCGWGKDELQKVRGRV